MKKFFSNKTNILLSLVLIAILTGLIFLIGSFFEKPKIYAIDYSKLTEQEIKAWAENEGITGENLKISYQYDESVEKGKPVSQKPKDGEEIKDILSIVISQGPDPTLAVEVPAIEGMTKETIATWFQRNHFPDVTYEYVLDKDHPKDTVLALNVSGSVKRETPILVTLSAGDNADNVKITVPDFSTYSKTNITAWGESNQVNIKFVYVFSDTVAEGSVIDQGTRAGADISPGGTITVTVSSGKAVELEDLYNMTASEAKAWADKNNITLNFINYYSNEVAEGRIISTSPKAHTLVSSGSTVRAYLSIGKDPAEDMVKVDDQHVGVTEAAFLEYIDSLGLKVQKQSYAYYSSQIDKDHIFYYDDGEFKKGATISYALSAGPFNLDLKEIEGKTRSEVNNYMYTINNLNGHLSITYTEEQSTDKADGTVYGCTQTTGAPYYEVACKVAVNESSSSDKTYWIDFDPNGGSGTMARVTVTAGSNYKLPNCTFTAPAGKEFEKWDEGYAGDTVTINSNRRMIAQWKNKGGSSTSYLPPLEILDGVGGNSYQEKKTNLQNSSFL
ncbi:MAG: PASTA domain-containing protein, partial [Erysipelotrichaceae bacterium]|nr:PASTA domain-containing protein [Erysipelotrichaceae bacterium]